MAAKYNLASQLRSFFSKAVLASAYIYVLSLPTSGAAIELASVGLTIFMVLVALADRLCSQKLIEWHTLGVEMPLLIFTLTLAAGLILNAPADGLTHGALDAALLFYRMGLMLVLFSMALQVVKNLNAVFTTLLTVALAVSIYGVWQYFTGQDLIRHTSLMLVDEGSRFYKSQGTFHSPLTFAHTVMMVACLPWAAFLLGSQFVWWKRALSLLAFIVLVLAVVFSHGRGAWIALLITVPVMAVFVSRKALVYVLLTLAVVFFAVNKLNPEIKTKLFQTFSESPQEAEEKRLLWEVNLAMFKDHPWIGVGYKQNEVLASTYAAKLNLQPTSGQSHSNYIEFLATTGLVGFFSYMLFLLAFILMTARLLTSIPSTHTWHKVFVLAALGAQLAFHIGGLTHRNFGDDIVLHQFLFWLAVISYMSQRYYAHIVPDDRSI